MGQFLRELSPIAALLIIGKLSRKCGMEFLAILLRAVVPENLIRADSRHEVKSAHYST
jgi:hypothetical protein